MKSLLTTNSIRNRFRTKPPLQTLCGLGGKVFMIVAHYKDMILLYLSSNEINNGMHIDQQSLVLINRQEEDGLGIRTGIFHCNSLAGQKNSLFKENLAYLGAIFDARTLITDAAESVHTTCSWRKKNKF